TRADGGVRQAAARLLARHRARAEAGLSEAPDARTFGRDVLGPVVAKFCLLIWAYAAQAAATDRAALLFCTRGGIGIRGAYARAGVKFGLPDGPARGTLMVSRLVAARAAVMARSAAALEELAREFRGRSFAEVAEVLGCGGYALPEPWHAPFRRDGFYPL